MILRRTIALPGVATATLRELTVGDFRRLLDGGEAPTPESVLALCPDAILLSGELADLGADALADVWKQFVELNRALFPVRGKSSGPLRRKKSAEKLDENCLALIEIGHIDVWSYPYRLYVMALEGKWRQPR